MKANTSIFDEHEVLHELKHFLPAQAPLKDFIHHNTLHVFQNLKFKDGLRNAAEIFGYKVSLPLSEFRSLHASKQISHGILEKVLLEKKGAAFLEEWKNNLLLKDYDTSSDPRIGKLRATWKRHYKIDLDVQIHPKLFRILCSYLDQGIAIWDFPASQKGFLTSIREMEGNTFSGFFRTARAKQLLLDSNCGIAHLLDILVGDPVLYKHYLFDQQFAHQGWAGMVSSVEDFPQTLLKDRKITVKDLIIFELLLEIDTLDAQFGKDWEPLKSKLEGEPEALFAPVPQTELDEVMALWQEIYEWSFYDQVLAGIKMERQEVKSSMAKTFQAFFCIDDRECSFRRYLEKTDVNCETFATPGFFSVEFFFQPEEGKFYTKLCPAPVTPKFLIKEIGNTQKRPKDFYFTQYTHSIFGGWLISQTLGFWSAFRLFLNIFRPSLSPATAHSFKHMDKVSRLTIENKNGHRENDLQVGFTIDEMVPRVEGMLKSVGLVMDFAPVVYLMGHGASSVNNPHYAAYDCGACCGRPGSVNARVMSYMANHPEVRAILSTKGILIPETTQFIGGLHDTTRDEVLFFDEALLSAANRDFHKQNETVFAKALDLNSKERSRRLESIDSKLSPAKIHKKILKRSVSLFEPRPELNHASNALCVVGRRAMTKDLFLDRRAFMNSFDYKVDPDGTYLFTILKAAAPVCGGINLEYFFSRVDNQKLGAGTKLPHNVMGLIGVANGIDGDLRPGLPAQMIEVHDPIRLLIVVEHFPEVVLKTIQKNAETYEWFINEWVHLVVVNPETNALSYFKEGAFTPYELVQQRVETLTDLNALLETSTENLPVCLIP